MGQGGRRVLVDEPAGGDEVAGHLLGVASVEAAQGRADRRVELTRIGPLGDVGAGRQRRAPVGSIGGTALVAAWRTVVPARPGLPGTVVAR
jgi:hypothetical protein